MEQRGNSLREHRVVANCCCQRNLPAEKEVIAGWNLAGTSFGKRQQTLFRLCIHVQSFNICLHEKFGKNS